MYFEEEQIEEKGVELEDIIFDSIKNISNKKDILEYLISSLQIKVFLSYR